MSTRFGVRDDFTRLEHGSDGPAKKTRKFLGNSLQGLLSKPDAIDFHSAVGSNQIISGHVGDAVVVRCGIAVIVQESWEADAVFGAEVTRVPRVILRNGPEGCAVGGVGLVEAFEKRKRELTNGA